MNNMNDPHVDTLTYRVESVGPHSFNYENAQPLSHNAPDIGKFTIAGGTLTVRLSAHYSDEELARHYVEHFLKGWEIHNDLMSNYGAIRFRFSNCVIIDRNPLPGKPVPLSVSAGIGVSASAKIIANARTYPAPPPSSFSTVTDLVRDAHWRWSRYKEGKEPLHSMAYYVLTLVQNEGARLPGKGSNRQKASRRFDIEEKVLSEIGYISSEAGTTESARKDIPNGGSKYIPSGASEDDCRKINSQLDHWLVDATTKVIFHIGLNSTSQTGTRLTLSDLPTLPPLA